MADNITILDSAEVEKTVATHEMAGAVHANKQILIDHDGNYTPNYTGLAIAQGGIAGYSSMNKFGENPDIDTGTDPEDIWDYGGTYTFSTTADITQISSSDNGDNQEITVIGLNSSWEEVTQTKDLTGQTAATLGTALVRVYRAYNSDSTEFDGDVYITTTGAGLSSGVPTTANTVRAMIRPEHQQTLMCIYTVPADRTAYFTSGYVSFSKGKKDATADFAWKARGFGGVFQTKSKIGVSAAGSSAWSYNYGVPVTLPAKTDVKITCEEVSSDNSGVSGGFDLILVENE